MNRSLSLDTLVFITLVTAGAAVRLAMQDWPNFTPVAAIALFAGYYFRNSLVAMAVPTSIMLISNLMIGPYHSWATMIAVYTMLAVPVLCRTLLRKTFRFDDCSTVAAWGSFFGLFGCSLAASLAFFAVTNFACWLSPKMYDQDFAGLVLCYTRALPFFKNTLIGDLAFSLSLFGAYGLAARYSNLPIRQPQPTVVAYRA